MKMNLKSKFTALGAISVLLVLLYVLISFWSSNQKSSQLSLMRTIAGITQRHMESDMMHDAMRSDVLTAVLAIEKNSINEIREARSALKEHYDTFIDNLSKNKAENIPDSIRGEFEAALNSVNKYNASAKAVIDANGKNQDMLMAKFTESFEELEEIMEKVSDDIGKWAENEENESVSKSAFAEKIVLLIALLTISISVFIPLYSRRSIFNPQDKLVKSMDGLAKGENTEIPGTERHDEIGDM
ncbi:hypothetical protein N9W34_06790, partial [Rickettsiales bacterium]|nr:hypothetical protein [Rickettsiales bacterium]